MGTRVYVGRVSHHARNRDIERFFKGYGKIRDVMLKNGYCFVVRILLPKQAQSLLDRYYLVSETHPLPTKSS